jgi:acetyltransferase-like isoleucine patch superfamily enzyme
MEDKVCEKGGMMKQSCEDWVIPEPKKIQYGHQKRTLRQKIRKIVNTILSQLAYSCPVNGLRVQFHRWRGIHIGKNVYIGMYCLFDNLSPSFIYIMDDVSINANSMVLTHFNAPERYESVFEPTVKPVVFKQGSMVAVRCTVMPGVTIGKYAIVSAGMVVDKDVEDYALVREKRMREDVNLKFLYKNHEE